MESRKIQKVGERSYSISLPKDWVLNNKLKEKDMIFLEPTDNNEIIIRTNNAPVKEPGSLTVDVEKIDNIKEFIAFCYVKNINNLVLNSKKFEYETIQVIKGLLKYLEGYDIVDQDHKKIEISFLFNEFNITLPKINLRMRYLMKLMLSELENQDYDLLNETETSIDRLHNLSKRIIFACRRSRKIREDNGITHEDDLFFHQDILKKLENMADSIYDLNKQKVNENSIKIANQLLSTLDSLFEKKSKVTDIQKSLSKVDPAAADPKAVFALQKMKDLCNDVVEDFVSIQFNKKFFS